MHVLLTCLAFLRKKKNWELNCRDSYARDHEFQPNPPRAEADSLIPILNSASVANFLLWTPAFVSGRQFKSTSWFYDVSKKEKNYDLKLTWEKVTLQVLQLWFFKWKFSNIYIQVGSEVRFSDISLSSGTWTRRSQCLISYKDN